MADKQPKPVTLVTIDPFKYNDRHYAKGDILKDVEPEMAMDLTGAGRTALATEDDIKAAAKAAKSSSAAA